MSEDNAAERPEWWRSAVIYQIYPRSFMDGNGDGIGDLSGITSRLTAIKDLGVDAVWLSPFYPSPQKDAGYDVADFKDVDPLFGNLADFDQMIEEAHSQGLKVIVDLVPNHTSDQHRWFREALSSPPGSPERNRYLFRDGKGEDGQDPPNNWKSAFGGPAWTRIVEQDGLPGQWYLHLFDSSQPDLNWRNPRVIKDFDGVLTFWLDRGVDGFRVDVARALVKQSGLPNQGPNDGGIEDFFIDGSDDLVIVRDDSERKMLEKPANPYSEQPEAHQIFRRWRTLMDRYAGDRVLISEAWVSPLAKMALWVRPGEFDQTFNFVYLYSGWNARRVRAVIEESLKEFGRVGAISTWVLSNHDVIRHASRLALSGAVSHGDGIGPNSPSLPDPEVGIRRARCASLLMLALPGSAYIYNGEELGLPEVVEITDEQRQDPTWERSQHTRYGRDGCRVPIPWEADLPGYGFSQTGRAWLPQPEYWGEYARKVELEDPDSTLNLYRNALRIRTREGLGSGEVEWLKSGTEEVVAFENSGVTIIANFGEDSVSIPEGDVLAVSTGLEEGMLPAESTVWLSNG